MKSPADLPKELRTGNRRFYFIENPSPLQAAMAEWYCGLDEEQRTVVDRLVVRIVAEIKSRNDQIQFGPSSAFELIGAGIAVQEGWRRGRKL